ncbi:deaminase [Amycolatopsis antarctica]|uniref:Deaminase n=1 Tax=Amycolatopsis antarctica TaxID=1854586 RepID=A0A263D4H7_9PSEU|nr:dihydrofolate reductase family protein [Amycolatopsis antarctica]OZM73392.1 deaminase [Amycolatopsis antarctica]
MKLVVTTFLSLDGVMQAPGGPAEDTSGGFEHGGWLVPHFDDTLGELMDAGSGELDGLLLGRRTYEIFAAHWPHVTDEVDPFASKANTVPKYVASRTLDSVGWHNSTLLTDVAEEVAKLKTQPGDELQVHGSGELVRTLMRHDLVDVYRLFVFPVVLGGGKRLFAEGTVPTGLRLTGTSVSATGVAIHSYERSGPLSYGSFTLDTEGV